MAKPAKPKDTLEQRIADLEREIVLRDRRIAELKAEIDETRRLLQAMEEHDEERAEYLETFVSTFGMTVDADGNWENGEFIKGYQDVIGQRNEMVDRYNKLVSAYNRDAVAPNPVGRPIAASEAQQALIIKHHKAGRSSRWIAEEMTLSRRTVTTIIDKVEGAGRTAAKHRARLGLEPKRKDWRPASIKRLPKQATKLFEKGRALLKEAKGLGRS